MARKARSGLGVGGRDKIKRQKSFELVAPAGRVVEQEVGDAMVATTRQETSIIFNTGGSLPAQIQAPQDEKVVSKRSASESLAARRRANPRAFRHGPHPLMSAEDYMYVRRDLIRIALLSVLMITGIVVLYLLLGR